MAPIVLFIGTFCYSTFLAKLLSSGRLQLRDHSSRDVGLKICVFFFESVITHFILLTSRSCHWGCALSVLVHSTRSFVFL
jgi:hypothetical protein